MIDRRQYRKRQRGKPVIFYRHRKSRTFSDTRYPIRSVFVGNVVEIFRKVNRAAGACLLNYTPVGPSAPPRNVSNY